MSTARSHLESYFEDEDARSRAYLAAAGMPHEEPAPGEPATTPFEAPPHEEAAAQPAGPIQGQPDPRRVIALIRRELRRGQGDTALAERRLDTLAGMLDRNQETLRQGADALDSLRQRLGRLEQDKTLLTENLRRMQEENENLRREAALAESHQASAQRENARLEREYWLLDCESRAMLEQAEAEAASGRRAQAALEESRQTLREAEEALHELATGHERDMAALRQELGRARQAAEALPDQHWQRLESNHAVLKRELEATRRRCTELRQERDALESSLVVSEQAHRASRATLQQLYEVAESALGIPANGEARIVELPYRPAREPHSMAG